MFCWRLHPLVHTVAAEAGLVLLQRIAGAALVLPELRPALLSTENKRACDRGGGESHRARRRQLRWSWRPATAPCSP